jgi:hypothetical protein
MPDYEVTIDGDDVKLGTVTLRHVSDHGKYGEEYIGDSHFEFDTRYVRDYVLLFGGFGLPYFDNEFLEDIHLFADSTVQHTSLDANIAMCEWFYNDDKELIIDVTSDHIFWLVHDLLHSLHDCQGGYLQVSTHAERNRHLEAFKICWEAGKILPENKEMFEKICEEQSEGRGFQRAEMSMFSLLRQVEVTAEYWDWCEEYWYLNPDMEEEDEDMDNEDEETDLDNENQEEEYEHTTIRADSN